MYSVSVGEQVDGGDFAGVKVAASPARDGVGDDILGGAGDIDGHAEFHRRRKRAGEFVEQSLVAVGRLDENLRLSGSDVAFHLVQFFLPFFLQSFSNLLLQKLPSLY